MIRQRIENLRREMRLRGIDLYVIPTSDFHDSEYVGDYFKAREYLTGFTGSAGTAVITMDSAGLWTDGRYFLQAEQQLSGSGVMLYKMGEEGVPTVRQYVEKTLPAGGTIGFDGRVVSGKLGKCFADIARKKGGKLSVHEDLVDLIWADRPEMSHAPVTILPMQYAGKSASEKLSDVRRAMAEKGADVHLMADLCAIAWLLNLRGSDIESVPVALSYLALRQESCIFYLQPQAVTPALRAYLDANGVEMRPYAQFYDDCAALPANACVLLDPAVVNYRICSSLPETVRRIDAPDPASRMKAVKNPVEMANLREAHLKDAVAMCRFLYWLKTSGEAMTERSAAAKLEDFRREQAGFLAPSFETICAYGPHGAIVHYAATEQSDVPIGQGSLLLVDSGGHYLEGTTDITRTVAMGEVSAEMKRDCTAVCRAMLNLMNARFLSGCTGANLDILARGPLWDAGLDYKHGTGHGVGYLLNVHEGPNAFRWRIPSDMADCPPLEEGMVTTDEPGLYIAGSHGVRTENELLCRKGEKNEFGQFLYFENLTFVPIDLDTIDPDLMNETERSRLNAYHAAVYAAVAPGLHAEEAAWLKICTRAI